MINLKRYSSLEIKRAADRKHQQATRDRQRRLRMTTGWKPRPCSLCLSTDHPRQSCPLNTREDQNDRRETHRAATPGSSGFYCMVGSMSRYANNTSVSVAKSKAEIEQTLRRYGATGFMSAWQEDPPTAMIGFTINERLVKMQVKVPAQNDEEFTLTETGRERNSDAAYKSWEQACRQRWRALALIVKAKLEAVECGISTIEREFLADIVMPDGTTFSDWAGPQIEAMYNSGKMPQLLPAPKGRKR